MPVNEDRGMLFVSHTGDVYPCAQLHVSPAMSGWSLWRDLPQLTGLPVVAGAE